MTVTAFILGTGTDYDGQLPPEPHPRRQVVSKAGEDLIRVRRERVDHRQAEVVRLSSELRDAFGGLVEAWQLLHESLDGQPRCHVGGCGQPATGLVTTLVEPGQRPVVLDLCDEHMVVLGSAEHAAHCSLAEPSS